MKTKSPKQQLTITLNPEKEQKNHPIIRKQPKTQKPQIQQNQKSSFYQPIPSSSPKKRQQLKRVQDDIELMKNKILLLKIQLQKQQESIKMNKSKTEDVIRKKINVNKIQKYKVKDHSLDIERAEQLRARNASLRESHQSEMQNIFKAIYLVKLDDAREIKKLSNSHRQKISEMNDAIYNQQLQKKKKIAQDHQRAKQRYDRYWKQKLASISEGQNKAKEEIQKTVSEKRDQLKQLRDQQIKLLESMNKIQSKQLETKKQYLAALSLPVKDVAQALNRSKSSLDGIQSNSIEKTQPSLMNRMNSQMSKSKLTSGLTHNFSSVSSFDSLMFKDSLNEGDRYKQQQFKVPNSTVNKQKLKIILKELKRLDKKEKEEQISSSKIQQ